MAGKGEHLIVNGITTICTRNTALSDTDGSDCDVVIEASGTKRTSDKLLGFIIDAQSTMVVNQTHVKIYAWYDNEFGYANRTVELARLVAQIDQ